MTIHSEDIVKRKWPQLNTVRLIGWSILICVTFSIAMSYWDYRKAQTAQHQKVEASLHKAADIFIPLLNDSLWSLHTEQINHQMAAIVRFPYVAYAVLTTSDGSQLRFGTKPLNSKKVEITSTLRYKAAQKNQLLGTLTLYPDFYDTSKTFKNDVFTLFKFYMALSGALSACIITLCHLLTTARIRKITRFLDHISSSETHPNNRLLKNPLKNTIKDEYDELLAEVFKIWKSSRIAMKDNQASLLNIEALQKKCDELEQKLEGQEASDSLATNKERVFFKAILNALPYSISWRDHELFIRGTNQAFLDNVGAPDDSVLIGTKGEFYTPKERQKLSNADNFAIVHSGYKQINMEERILLASGVLVDALANKVPLYDDQGNIIGILNYYLIKSTTKNPQ